MNKEKVSAIKFDDITCFRSKHNVLTEPLNDDELRNLATKFNRLKLQVRISLEETIEAVDMEDFNLLIDTKILSADSTLMLSDMTYKAVGTKDGDLIIRVEANLEDYDESRGR